MGNTLSHYRCFPDHRLHDWWENRKPDDDRPGVAGYWTTSRFIPLALPWRTLPFLFLAAWIAIVVVYGQHGYGSRYFPSEKTSDGPIKTGDKIEYRIVIDSAAICSLLDEGRPVIQNPGSPQDIILFGVAADRLSSPDQSGG